MNNFTSWLSLQWPAIVAGVGGIAAAAGALVKWGSWGRKAYGDRQTKRRDARVLAALGNPDLWKDTPRPMTGAGNSCVRAGEIANILSLTGDVVADSLERLEAEGKVRNHGGSLSNPAPLWSTVRRF